ncbi:MAG: Crp/Fnr family transcriptional regulator [Aridibacter sp.]
MKSLEKMNIKNLILKNLSETVYGEIESHLEEVEMLPTEYLYLPKEKIKYIYFPETSVISIVTCLENGESVEAGIVGKEGVVGASIVFADDVSPTEATIQLGGIGYRMKVAAFKDYFDDNKEFRNAVLYYVYSFIAQISQNSACLCHHTIEKRLARWLLMFSDRADSEKLVLTQQFIAQMLGVKRPSVSINANKLQQMELISYNRGTIKILNRTGLENLTCECYDEINKSLKGFSV